MAYNLFAQDKQQNYPDIIEGTELIQQPATDIVQQEQQPVKTQSAQTTIRKTEKTAHTMPAIDMNDPTSGMDAISQMYTSPQEEERLRRASVANRRILAVGDALRHIGNIYNTVRYAPAQKLNSPVVEEQARYEKGKALRDAANLRYYSYQQAKAAQDAKARQWEQQFRYNQAKDARDYELKKSESEARNNLREAQRNRYQTMIALDEARREGIISDNEYKKQRALLYPGEVQSRINKNNRTGGGRSGMSDYTTTKQRIVTKKDPLTGKPIEWKDVTERKTQHGKTQGSRSGGSGNNNNRSGFFNK